MPELPDVAAYISALDDRIVGEPLQRVRIADPFLLRTTDPPVSALEGRTVRELRRIGKRIAIGFDGELWLVIHLMIAGRLHWRTAGATLAGRTNLAAFDFPNGTLTLTEAGTKRRAALQLLRGENALSAIDPGGIDVFSIDVEAFRAALAKENHTLKRALTDPRVIDGIGNAYSDEILHAAHLSPLAMTQKLTPAEWERLFSATRETLQLWIDRLAAEARNGFPEKVTAFRKEMAVHGRYKQPCPTCGQPVQRIRYADNETNYCPTCQTAGKLLADRALSRLLGPDWHRRAMIVALPLLLLNACGAIAEKAREGREIAQVMQPGRSYRSFFTPSAAMAPTIHKDTDLIVVDTSAYKSAGPQRGDIIVFKAPIHSSTVFLKRVIAIAGDRVAFRKGRIEVNGRPWTPPGDTPNYELAVAHYHIIVDGVPLDPVIADVPGRAAWSAPDRLPKRCYFVVGDNLNNSEDSHIFGCAELTDRFTAGQLRGEPTELIGKVVKIIPKR